MKTFAINLHFIAGSIEGFLVTPRLSKYVVSIFVYGLQKMHASYLLPIVFSCRGYVCTYQFYLNWKLISPKWYSGNSDQ